MLLTLANFASFVWSRCNTKHDIGWIGDDVKVIDDCNILEDKVVIFLDQLVAKIDCIGFVSAKLGRAARYVSSKPSTNTSITNGLTRMKRCYETQASVRVKPFETSNKYETNFMLDPLVCFNSEHQLLFSLNEQKGNIVRIDLVSGVFKTNKLRICLTQINILNSRGMKVWWYNPENCPDNDIRCNTQNSFAEVTVDPCVEENFKIFYKFKSSRTRIKTVKIPIDSNKHCKATINGDTSVEGFENEEDNSTGGNKQSSLNTVTIAVIASGGAGGVLIILAIILAMVFWRRRSKRKDKKMMEQNKDLNPVYGTYSRGWDGEGDYGDGDVIKI